MRVFVTGGTGFIGSAVVRELLGAGHEVLGLARSDAAADALSAAGARAHRGTLTDPGCLQAGAAQADGVVHAAVDRDSADFASALQTDRRALAALALALAGSDRPLVFASNTAMLAPGRVLTENDAGDPSGAMPRRDIEAEALTAAGVRTVAVRLPPSVHGQPDRGGSVPLLIRTARRRGASAYVDDGGNRWPAVHQLDAAHLFRLALEHARAGTRVHAVGDEGIPFREIATVIGRHLGVPAISITPDEVAGHFDLLGPLAFLTGADIPASNAATRERLDWKPAHPGLLADLEAGFYFGPGRGPVS
jgi:nucleoside-diphosphate-sugar epimerase